MSPRTLTPKPLAQPMVSPAAAAELGEWTGLAGLLPKVDGGHKLDTIALTQMLEDVLESQRKPAPSEADTTAPGTPAVSEKGVGVVKTEAKDEEPDPAGPPDELTPVQKCFQACAENGGQFELRGTTIGAQWYRALKLEPDLCSDYGAVKGRENQVSFRAAWAQKQWQKICNKRIERKEEVKEDSVVGEFVSVRKWLVDQGDGEDAAEALKFFLNKVMALGPNERCKYVKRDEWTNQIQVAVPKAGWRDGRKESWAIEEHHEIGQPSASSHQQGAAAGAATTAARAATAGAATPNAIQKAVPGTKPAAATPQGVAGKLKRLKSSANLLDPDEAAAEGDDKKKRAKCVNDTWGGIKVTKAKLDEAMGAASQLIRAVDSTPGWAWVRKIDLYEEVKAKREEVEGQQRSSDFWRRLLLHSVQQARKDVGKDFDVQSQVAMSTSLSREATNLHEKVNELLKLLRARP